MCIRDRHGIDARQKFWDGLAGITDPELKRKAIGRMFIEVFEEEAHAYPAVKWLGQGTIYPDVIESISCLLYTSPSPRDRTRSRMPSSA
mgnify:CR=1 FL=1